MKNKGFTLTELMIVLAILAMLMAYAIPNYRQYVLKSKRTVAQNRLLEVAGLFEKFYANTNSYPAGLTGGAANLSLSSDYLASDEYTLTVAYPVGGGWTLSATATGGQAQDTDCSVITLNNIGARGPSAECWE